MKTQLKVWIPQGSLIGPQAIAEADPAKLTSLCYTHAEMGSSNWTLVGSATVEVTFLETAELIEQKRQSLEAQLQQEIATSHVRQEKLRDQIQNLLALPSEVS